MQKNNKKNCYIITFILLFMCFFSPIKTNALTLEYKNNNNININYITNINSLNTFEVRHSMADCGDSLLGNPNDEDSVAWLLQYLLNMIKIVGPILVIVLSSVDFLKVIVKSDDDAMAGAAKKLGYRLILAGLLFFIPTIVTAILQLFGITSDPTCGIQ